MIAENFMIAPSYMRFAENTDFSYIKGKKVKVWTLAIAPLT